MKAMFETTCEYLNLNFKGSVYMEGSGIYDHSIVSAMWKLGGSQELLDTYRKALDAHGMDEKILSPALRFTTSDVAASGANLYPMLLTDGPNGVISLGSPIKLAHDKGATILDFRKNLEQVCARYVDAMKNLTQLMDIEIRNPVNCLKLLMKDKATRKISLGVIVLTSVQNFGYYGIMIWMPSFLSKQLGFNLTKSSMWTAVTILGMMAGIWAFGQIADRIGRKPSFLLFQAGAVVMVLVSRRALRALNDQSGPGRAPWDR